MKNRFAAFSIFAALSIAAIARPVAGADQTLPPEAVDFINRIDSRALGLIQVQYEGRIAILDTLARRQIKQICGPNLPGGLPAAGIYLELYLNAGAYLDKPVIFVKDQPMRNLLAGKLQGQARQDLLERGELAPWTVMDRNWGSWLVKTGRIDAEEIKRANEMPSLADMLNVAGSKPELKLSVDRLSASVSAFAGTGDLRIAPQDPDWLPAFNLSMIESPNDYYASMKSHFMTLTEAWRARDAEVVNAAVLTIRQLQAEAAGTGTLPAGRAEMELIFNRLNSVSILFAVCGISALLALLYAAGFRKIRIAVVASLCLTATVLLGLFLVRWVLSGASWYMPPLMNMYEGVFASAMVAAVAAAVGELVRRGNWLSPAAGLYAMVAVLGCNWLDGGFSAHHGILNSPIMAAHVAIIIIGHAMVGVTCLSSIIFLLFAAHGRIFRRSAGSQPQAAPGVLPQTLRQIDDCTALVAKLALLFVAMGTMLGAFWGDIAWGRWWGWDPKETWSLITVLVFVLVVHIRTILPVGRRELATALLCLIGTSVMLFNWIVVNFFIAGKHSYA